MQCLMIVLNKVELLETLLQRFMDNGICGATIINSTGMIKELAKTCENYPIFGTIRLFVDRKENRPYSLYRRMAD